MNPQPYDNPIVVQSDGSLALDDVDALKKYDCQRYPQCLAVACRNAWPQFTCAGCDAYLALPDDHYARRLWARAGATLLRDDTLARSQARGVDPDAAARERHERMCAMRRKAAATRNAKRAEERERIREFLLARAETELDRERIGAILDGRLRPNAIERAQLQVLRERVRAERASADD